MGLSDNQRPNRCKCGRKFLKLCKYFTKGSARSEMFVPMPSIFGKMSLLGEFPLDLSGWNSQSLWLLANTINDDSCRQQQRLGCKWGIQAREREKRMPLYQTLGGSISAVPRPMFADYFLRSQALPDSRTLHRSKLLLFAKSWQPLRQKCDHFQNTTKLANCMKIQI